MEGKKKLPRRIRDQPEIEGARKARTNQGFRDVVSGVAQDRDDTLIQRGKAGKKPLRVGAFTKGEKGGSSAEKGCR